MVLNTPIHTNEQSVDRVLRAGRPVVLVFWQSQCPPCEQLDPVLDRLSANYAGKALIAKVDVRDNPALAARYKVNRLPALVFIKDGTTMAQTSGAVPEATLQAWLEHLVAGGPRPAITDGPSIALDGTSAQSGPNNSPHQRPSAHGTSSPPGPGPIVVTDANFDQVVLNSKLPVLVDYWAPWCGPCRMVAPTVERLAQEYAGRAVVAKLNVDENRRVTQQFAITSIPALFIFKNGQVAERLFGAQPATVLQQALARHTGP